MAKKVKEAPESTTTYFSQCSAEAQSEILELLPKKKINTTLWKRTNKRSGEVTYVYVKGTKQGDFTKDQNYNFVFCPSLDIVKEEIAMDYFKEENKEA